MSGGTGMGKALRSPVAKCGALLAGYVAALSLARSYSVSFDRGLAATLQGFPGQLRVRSVVVALLLEPMPAVLLFVSCVVVFALSVWGSKAREEPPVWRSIDGAWLVVSAYGAVLTCIHFMRSPFAPSFGYHSQMVFFSAVVYAIVMVLLAEIVARVRDGQLQHTLYWPRFFGLYPPRRPVGLLMALLLAGNLLLLFVSCPIDAAIGARLRVLLLLLLLSHLGALTYLCAFVLSLSMEYDKANSEKIRAERFKSELIANVSHDIRTPLTSIISYVDLLKGLPIESADFTEYVNVLDRKTIRLKTLTSDLMEASKAGTGNLDVDMCEIDLVEIIGQVAGEFDDQLNERSVALVFRQPDTPVLTKADSRHLWRILENLFGNAAKYAMPGTRVFAEITLRDDKPVFFLRNTSQNPIDLPGDILTEQFIRDDRARHAEGSGLGLYIAKSLAELMGEQLVIRATGDLFEAEMLFG